MTATALHRIPKLNVRGALPMRGQAWSKDAGTVTRSCCSRKASAADTVVFAQRYDGDNSRGCYT